MKILSILSLFLLGLSLNAQSYRVYFSDKGENEGMINDPFSFLSAEAIERRSLRQTPVDRTDLPVSAEYLEALKERGLQLKMKSRWFNYALVEGENVVEKLEDLPFVTKVELAHKYRVVYADVPAVTGVTALTYGLSANQIEMLNGDYLHDRNFLGQGMTIAVIDGGFSGADLIDGLDSLRNSGRVMGSYNFITRDTNVYQVGSHGSDVLSVMAGYVDSNFAGTAIGANYWLLQSEDQTSETVVEMDNWLAAAEFADSVGADVINSSLGYNTFDGGIGDLNYSDLDGNTALVTKAADMAARKGILVVNSAGNEGNSSWKHILAPADGDSVLAIGGVDEFGGYVSFASQGPSADGRIKPDVSARAAGAAYTGVLVRQGNGTSFASPIVAGLAACFWQQKPSLTNMEVYDIIKSTASHANNPNNQIGFGIPNFAAASWTIGNPENRVNQVRFEVYPNPVEDRFFIDLNGINTTAPLELTLYDMTGRLIWKSEMEIVEGQPLEVQSPDQKGSYLLSLKVEDKLYLHRIIR